MTLLGTWVWSAAAHGTASVPLIPSNNYVDTITIPPGLNVGAGYTLVMAFSVYDATVSVQNFQSDTLHPIITPLLVAQNGQQWNISTPGNTQARLPSYIVSLPFPTPIAQPFGAASVCLMGELPTGLTIPDPPTGTELFTSGVSRDVINQGCQLRLRLAASRTVINADWTMVAAIVDGPGQQTGQSVPNPILPGNFIVQPYARHLNPFQTGSSSTGVPPIGPGLSTGVITPAQAPPSQDLAYVIAGSDIGAYTTGGEVHPNIVGGVPITGTSTDMDATHDPAWQNIVVDHYKDSVWAGIGALVDDTAVTTLNTLPFSVYIPSSNGSSSGTVFNVGAYGISNFAGGGGSVQVIG